MSKKLYKPFNKHVYRNKQRWDFVRVARNKSDVKVVKEYQKSHHNKRTIALKRKIGYGVYSRPYKSNYKKSQVGY